MRMFRWAVVASALGVSACAPAISGSADGIAKLEQARASNPKSEAVLRSLGIAYFKANRYSDAQGVLRQATTLDPKDGVAALYLGLTAEAQHDLPAAKAAYESYLGVGKTRGVKDQITARLTVIARQENDASAKQAIAQDRQLSSVPGPVTTIAVMPFLFAGSDTTLKPLERGFAELVTTDLSRISVLKVVERAHLQALVDEIQLQRTAGAQTGTGVRVGRMLQAGSLVGGSISQIGTDRLNATAIVTNVQSTAQVGTGATDQQPVDQLFTLEKNLVLKLLADMHVTPTTAERNAIEQRPTRSLAAFLAYSRGLELEDQGRFDDAGRSFDNALRIDPSFLPAQQKGQETRAVISGNAVTAGTVESGLRGTGEGAVVVAAAKGSTSGSTNSGGGASSLADGLNPSVAGGATGLGGSTTTPPSSDASSGTGADNPSTKTAKVTVIVRSPKS